MSGLLVNIDVGNLERAMEFYCAAFDLRMGRRFEGAAELLGAATPIYLLSKAPGTRARAAKAGATMETEVNSHAWGTIALLADPFGNGFCLLQFTGRGYDEIAL